MLRLSVTRIWFSDKSTIGALDIAGVQQCYSLEPSEASGKLIPPGTYRLVLLPSKRFETYTPHVLNVPGRSAIEIHPGNYPFDTEGCALVGQYRSADFVGNSREAFNELIAQLDAAQDMQIQYTEQREVSA